MHFLIAVIAIIVLVVCALLYFVIRKAVKDGFVAGYCKIHRLNPHQFDNEDD